MSLNYIPGLSFDNGGAAPQGLSLQSFGQYAPLNVPQAFNSKGITYNAGPTKIANYNVPAPSNTNTSHGTISTEEGAIAAGYRNLQDAINQGAVHVDPYASIRNDISSSWDNYLNSLNDTSGYITTQRDAQQNIANTQYDQGVQVANTQKAKSLRDIANTTRNAFQAGNNYLGSLGAGDSSAANQYAFAINQEANKQTGSLNEFVDSQISNLGYQRDQQINQIATWFAQQQQFLKNQIAQGQLSKGQDLNNLSKNILDQAIAATNQVKTNAQNQYNGLLSWAANNSTNLGQLQQNIAGIPRAMSQIQSTGGVGAISPVYGGSPTQKTDIYGNPIYA